MNVCECEFAFQCVGDSRAFVCQLPERPRGSDLRYIQGKNAQKLKKFSNGVLKLQYIPKWNYRELGDFA